MKKRLAVIGGGAQTIPSYRAMLKLIAKEYDLTVFSEFYISKEQSVEEYNIQSVSSNSINRRWREFSFLMMIVRSFFSKRPIIIHSHSTYPSGVVAILCGWLFSVPVVVCLDAAEGSSVEEIKFGDLLNNRRRRINEWVIEKATCVTALTHYQAEEVKKNLLFKKQINVIPRGVDVNRFNTIRTANSSLRFLSIAYLHPVKDHSTMLRAFQLILKQRPESSLTIVGEDYDNGRMQKLSEELGIADRIYFVGFVSHASITQFYQQSDVLLHTSLFESQAMAVVEAMASGILVCGTHVGIMADLSGECCVTVAVKDHVALAIKVIELLNDKKEQDRLRSNALKWVNEHALQWTTQQYLDLYCRIS